MESSVLRPQCTNLLCREQPVIKCTVPAQPGWSVLVTHGTAGLDWTGQCGQEPGFRSTMAVEQFK